MKEIIEVSRDFKIIPHKFQSATSFEVKDFTQEGFRVVLPYAKKEELGDYVKNDEVEVFGSNDEGLIYFVTEILDKSENLLTIKFPEAHKTIQRREYSRVKFSGNIEFEGIKDIIIKPDDISAGGLRLYCSKPLEIGAEYPISLSLTNNLDIKCTLQPIRISECNEKTPDNKPMYAVSGRFKNIESIDRIALVQYSFRALMEAENKKND